MRLRFRKATTVPAGVARRSLTYRPMGMRMYPYLERGTSLQAYDITLPPWLLVTYWTLGR